MRPAPLLPSSCRRTPVWSMPMVRFQSSGEVSSITARSMPALPRMSELTQRLLQGGGDRGFPLSLRGHVEVMVGRAATALPDVLDHLCPGRVLNVGHQHRGTVAGQPLRGSLTDSAGRTGHQCGPPVQPVHCSSLRRAVPLSVRALCGIQALTRGRWSPRTWASFTPFVHRPGPAPARTQACRALPDSAVIRLPPVRCAVLGRHCRSRPRASGSARVPSRQMAPAEG